MRDALLALHFQNDICHRDGLIPFSLDRSTSAAANFLSAGKSQPKTGPISAISSSPQAPAYAWQITVR